MSPAKKTATKKTTTRKTTRKTTRRKRGPAEPRGPEARESALDRSDEHVSALTERVEKAKGSVLASYRDPYAGLPLVLASLPIGSVEPTPFQRDLSRTHSDRLAVAIGASGLFLDPVIAIPSDDGFWSPNGRHRLAAAKQLGLRSITALLTDDPALAYRILALNTEKAHNLRDRALEVIRMARALAKESPRSKEATSTSARSRSGSRKRKARSSRPIAIHTLDYRSSSRRCRLGASSPPHSSGISRGPTPIALRWRSAHLASSSTR
ncbi:MAG: hypothetical protein E6J23_10990 [Chloroflexi bacterium]|nr:MAG: hypothetical protein E6J23_10990 [Chloroflexota bacterium]